MSNREKIIKMLRDGDPAALPTLLGKVHGIFRTLVSLSYDKESVISWRAIEAIGAIAGAKARSESGVVRTLVQRILWMMREESGNNPWSAPDMLGEIVRNSPNEFADIAPIIASFHDEEILRRGVLRAIARISEIRPDVVHIEPSIIRDYLRHSDAHTRYYALLIAAHLGLRELLPWAEALEEDRTEVKIYRNWNFEMVILGKIAKETVIIFCAERK